MKNRAPDKLMADLHYAAQSLFAQQMKQRPTDDPATIADYAYKAISEVAHNAALRRDPSGDSPKEDGYIFYEGYLTKEGQAVYLVTGLGAVYKNGDGFEGPIFSNDTPF